MAKGASRLGHADLREQRYMELLAEQLRIIASLVAKMDAITGNRRPEDAIEAKSDVTRDLSEKSSVRNESIVSGGVENSSTYSRAKNDSIAQNDATNDLIDKVKPGKKFRKLVFDISIAGIWALFFALYAESIGTTVQSLLWNGIELVGFPVPEILRALAIIWTF
jgi:hypothetical protein